MDERSLKKRPPSACPIQRTTQTPTATTQSPRAMSATNNNRSRESEIALLEKISTSLETFISAPDQAQVVRYGENSSIRISSADASRDAIKNVLAAKTLVRSIVKVCAKEKLKSGNDEVPDGLVDALVEEYRGNYPSLTVEKVNEALSRYEPTETSEIDPESDDSDVESAHSNVEGGETQAAKSFTTTLIRTIIMIDEEMDKYYEKIEALKKTREQRQQFAAAAQGEKVAPTKKRKDSNESIVNSPADPQKPKTKKRAKTGPRPKNTPENDLLNLIASRYATERERCTERISREMLGFIVEKAKKDMGMEGFDMPMHNISKKVRRIRLQNMANEDSDSDNEGLGTNKIMKKQAALIDEIYTRYSYEKEMTGEKLPSGTLDAIVDTTKAEMGMPQFNFDKNRIRCRFKREHPHFSSNRSTLPDIGTMSEETKRKRQLLFNEITARYVHEREVHNGKLPRGAMDLIISSAKDDLGIHDIEVPKSTIRGRHERESPHVMTLGKESPHNAIDEPLIQTINRRLNQGISVTRAQGLELAKSLLKEKMVNENETELNALWWSFFLKRNKHRLSCFADDGIQS